MERKKISVSSVGVVRFKLLRSLARVSSGFNDVNEISVTKRKIKIAASSQKTETKLPLTQRFKEHIAITTLTSESSLACPSSLLTSQVSFT